MTPSWSARLTEARATHDLSQAEVAHRLRALSREIDGVQAGVDRRMVRRWEHGTMPSARYRRLLCALYGMSPGQLGFDVPTNGVPASVAVREDDDVRRRQFLGLGLTATFSALEGRADGARRTVDLLLAREPIGADLDEWERTAHAYSCESATAPSEQLLTGLVADFEELGQLMERTRSEVEQRRLVHVAGQLAFTAAFTLIGVGQHWAARRWWRTARAASERAGDPVLAAFVRGHQATMALYGDYTPAHVLALTEETEAVAHRIPSAGLAEGFAARAQALALQGRARESRDALDALAVVFEQLPDSVTSERRSFYGWREQRLRYAESYAHTRLGDRARADAAQVRALALYEPHWWRGRAQVGLHRAESLIADGDIADGIEHATRTLQALAPQQRSDGFVRPLANDVLAAMPAQDQDRPAAQEYRELVATISGQGA